MSGIVWLGLLGRAPQVAGGSCSGASGFPTSCVLAVFSWQPASTALPRAQRRATAQMRCGWTVAKPRGGFGPALMQRYPVGVGPGLSATLPSDILLQCSQAGLFAWLALPMPMQLRAGNVLGEVLESEEPFDAIHVGAGGQALFRRTHSRIQSGMFGSWPTGIA